MTDEPLSHGGSPPVMKGAKRRSPAPLVVLKVVFTLVWGCENKAKRLTRERRKPGELAHEERGSAEIHKHSRLEINANGSSSGAFVS